MTAASYNKLQSQKNRPFRTVKPQSHTVVIGKDGLPSAVPIHKDAAALERKGINHKQRSVPAQRCDRTSTTLDALLKLNSQLTEKVQDKESRPESGLAECAVERIVGYKGHGQIRQYIFK